MIRTLSHLLRKNNKGEGRGLINFVPLKRGGLIEDGEPKLAGTDWQCWSEINAKTITAVKDVSYSNATGRPEKIEACQDSNPDFCNTGVAL